MHSYALPLAQNLPAAAPVISPGRIIRAVASSTAIETGQSIQDIETQLRSTSRFPALDLASPALV
ncbi:hypothetical protein [Castellaniella sp.]|uniref:hypothetical protein n=1 Tax=Castellaniella sp. TaxID=1955812 RepID=UPI002AFE03C5|nr:hypothetical protein [Castellaniella sp.]